MNLTQGWWKLQCISSKPVDRKWFMHGFLDWLESRRLDDSEYIGEDYGCCKSMVQSIERSWSLSASALRELESWIRVGFRLSFVSNWSADRWLSLWVVSVEPTVYESKVIQSMSASELLRRIGCMHRCGDFVYSTQETKPHEDSNLVDSASSIRLSQRLSHACLSISNFIRETANGSLYQL